MRQVNMHEAKTHLSRLAKDVANGETIMIAIAGKPMMKCVPPDEPKPKTIRRYGFLEGKYSVPDNFEELELEADKEIEKLFYGEESE
jgi:antitoxin (DNA-binding transcriptional repressor) of toxin-antitoxin stability system